MCDCQSYNRPDQGGSVLPVVLGFRKYFPDSAHETVCVDACIAPAIEALWMAGIRTVHSCCSHNGQFLPLPSVGVVDPARVVEAFSILKAFHPGWRIFTDLLPETAQ